MIMNKYFVFLRDPCAVLCWWLDLFSEYLRTGKKYRATPRGFLKQSIPSFREEFESYSLVSIKIKIIRYTTFLFTKRRTPRYKSGFKFLWRSDIITLWFAEWSTSNPWGGDDDSSRAGIAADQRFFTTELYGGSVS